VRLENLRALGPLTEFKEGYLGLGVEFDVRKRSWSQYILKILENVEVFKFRLEWDNVDFEQDLWMASNRQKGYFGGHGGGYVTDEIWVKNIKRAAMDSSPNGYYNLANSLAIIKNSSLNFETNIFIRMLKYYLLEGWKGAEPFVVSGRGIVGLTGDTAAPTKFLVLMNAAIMLENMSSRWDQRTHDVYFKLVKYIFQSPRRNTVSAKKFLSLIRQSALCITKEGQYVEWHHIDCQDVSAVIRGGNTVKITRNDEVYYLNTKEKIDEVLKLADETIPGLSKDLIYMMSGPLNDHTLHMLAMLYSVDGLAGFSRSQVNLAHAAQVRNDPETIVTKVPDIFIQALYDEYIPIVGHGMFRTYSEWLQSLPTSMTTKSAGGDAVQIIVETKDGPARLRFTDKMMVFLQNPEYYANPERFFKIDYTKEEPGSIGNRFVVGPKAARAIFMRRLITYVFELLFAVPVAKWILDKPLGVKAVPFATVHDFSAGGEDGVLPHDHVYGMYASSHAHIISMAQDYDTYDSTQKFANMRSHALQGMKLGLAGKKILDATWVEINNVKYTLGTILDKMWGKGQVYDAFYAERRSTTAEIPEDVSDDPKLMKLKLDMVFSGELMTLNVNNLTNRASMRCYVKTMPEFLRTMNLLRALYQGDDLIIFWELPKTTEGPKFTQKMHKGLVTHAVDNASNNGLVVSEVKTVTRIFFYEYLKKIFLYGRFIPLQLMQLLSRERIEVNSPNLEIVRGIRATCERLVMRGFDHDFCLNFVVYSYLVKSGVRVRGGWGKVFKPGTSGWYYFPIEVLFTPNRAGGVGLHPETVMFVSADMMIMDFFYHKAPEMVDRLRRSIAILQTEIKSPKDFVISALEGKKRGIITLNGKKDDDPFYRGRKYIRETQDQERVKTAYRVKESVESYIKIQDMFYGNLDESLLQSALRSNIGTKQFEIEAARSAGFQYAATDKKNVLADIGHKKLVSKFKRSTLKDSYWPWIQDIRVVPTDIPLKRSDKHPFSIMDERAKRVIEYMGMSTTRVPIALTPNAISQKLRSDTKFRRDITPEKLYEVLTNPAIVNTHERIVEVLLYLGARPDLANAVAVQISKSVESLSIATTAGGSPMTGAYFSCLDVTTSKLNSLYNHNTISFGTRGADAVISLFLMAKAALSFLNGGGHTLRYQVDNVETFRERVLKSLFPVRRPTIKSLTPREDVFLFGN
jgi:hypothetical protein